MNPCHPFDLARALAGEPVVTRDGRTVTDLAESSGSFSIFGRVAETVRYWTPEGAWNPGFGESPNDLCMANPPAEADRAPMSEPTLVIGTNGENGTVVQRAGGFIRVQWENGLTLWYDPDDVYGQPLNGDSMPMSDSIPYLEYAGPGSGVADPPNPEPLSPANPEPLNDRIEKALAPLADLLWELGTGRAKS